jgi:hypothetical protein
VPGGPPDGLPACRVSQEAAEARVLAAGRASTHEGEALRLGREAQALAGQLQAERAAVEQLQLSRDDLEVGPCPARVVVLPEFLEMIPLAAVALSIGRGSNSRGTKKCCARTCSGPAQRTLRAAVVTDPPPHGQPCSLYVGNNWGWV